jgi:hypothetical protein
MARRRGDGPSPKFGQSNCRLSDITIVVAQRDHFGLLRGARRRRIGENLQRRPQAIDQRLAIANLAQSLDTGQAVPQGQQPLSAEPRCAQLVERGDNDLVLARLSRRFAAVEQLIFIDDVNAHEGSSLPSRRHAGRDHTHALLRTASHSFRDNIVAFSSPAGAWNCFTGNRSRWTNLREVWGSPVLPCRRPERRV